jgi:hypothetical protein
MQRLKQKRIKAHIDTNAMPWISSNLRQHYIGI